MKRLILLWTLVGMLLSMMACRQADQGAETAVQVKTNGSATIERITVDSLEGLLDYEIYYCGISDFYVDLNGERLELREALAKDPTVIEAVLTQAESDAEAEKCTSATLLDGGTRSFWYEDHHIAKCHAFITRCRADGTLEQGYDSDVFIGALEMELSAAMEQRTLVENVNLGWAPDEETAYVYEGSTEPVKPIVILGKDGSFQFRWSALSSYLAMGSCSRRGSEWILKTSDGAYTFVFEEKDDTLIFHAESSSAVPKYQYTYDAEPRTTVPDGAVFIRK